MLPAAAPIIVAGTGTTGAATVVSGTSTVSPPPCPTADNARDDRRSTGGSTAANSRDRSGGAFFTVEGDINSGCAFLFTAVGVRCRSGETGLGAKDAADRVG